MLWMGVTLQLVCRLSNASYPADMTLRDLPFSGCFRPIGIRCMFPLHLVVLKTHAESRVTGKILTANQNETPPCENMKGRSALVTHAHPHTLRSSSNRCCTNNARSGMYDMGVAFTKSLHS